MFSCCILSFFLCIFVKKIYKIITFVTKIKEENNHRRTKKINSNKFSFLQAQILQKIYLDLYQKRKQS